MVLMIHGFKLTYCSMIRKKRAGRLVGVDSWKIRNELLTEKLPAVACHWARLVLV
jgi:hypothetical protein